MTEFDEIDEKELTALHEAAHLVVAVIRGHKVYATLKEEKFISVTGEELVSGGRTSFIGEMTHEELMQVYFAGYVLETVFADQTPEDAGKSAIEDFRMLTELEQEAEYTEKERVEAEDRALAETKRILTAEFHTVRRVAKALMTEEELTLTLETLYTV